MYVLEFFDGMRDHRVYVQVVDDSEAIAEASVKEELLLTDRAKLSTLVAPASSAAQAQLDAYRVV